MPKKIIGKSKGKSLKTAKKSKTSKNGKRKGKKY